LKKKVQKRIIGDKERKEIGRWGKLQDEEFQSSYSSPSHEGELGDI
jgi:hypothetical protein